MSHAWRAAHARAQSRLARPASGGSVAPAHMGASEKQPNGGRLGWVEVGRGIAALTVVFAHFPPVPDTWLGSTLNPGGMGVEFFFLLSGFIILHVHRAELGAPGSLGRYAWRRAGRIFPAYWAVLVLVLLFNQTLQAAEYRVPLSASYLASQALLLPGETLIGPAWTLRHELLFYGLFGAAIIHPRVGLVVLGAWLAAILGSLPFIGLSSMHTVTASEVLLDHYNIDFFLGMGMAVALQRGGVAWVTGTALAIATIALGHWAFHGFPADAPTEVFGYKALFLAALGGVILLSVHEMRAPAALLTLGTISYSLYLSNRDLGFMAQRVLRRLGMERLVHTWPAFAITSVLAVIVAYAFHVVVEKPAIAWVSSRPWAKKRA